MPRPFHRLDRDQLQHLLARYPMRREITEIHLHHTWRPRKQDFRGEPTLEAMWRFHTAELGWSDIAQHLTIDPDGGIWTGRDWNRGPASATGFNGSAGHGPFMIEMVGDFDRGADRLEGAQREAVVDALALLSRRFGLSPEKLRFHREMSHKTCPGSGIDGEELAAAVAGRLAALDVEPAAARSGPFSEEMLAEAGETQALIEHLSAPAAERGESRDEGEPPEERLSPEAIGRALGEAEGGTRGVRAGGVELTETVIDALKPYVVNLRQGLFSKGGLLQTAGTDVDRIFTEHLPRWAENQPRDEPLRIVFWAHGGMVSEKRALEIAHHHVQWWKDNGVYPIYFIWETHLFEIIRQLLAAARDRLPWRRRDLFDVTTDRLIEKTVRALGGRQVWTGIQASAERASADGGGAAYLASKLGAYLKADGAPEVELHAVGHSAGSIFHAHFLPRLVADTGAPVTSAAFLAPAVTVATFLDRVEPLVRRKGKKGIDQLSMFTLDEETERDDSTFTVYRKSILYLIHRALEARRKTPLLGLARNLRDDDRLRSLFGLDGGNGRAEAVFCPTGTTSGRSASAARHHTIFDEDRATMDSVLRRVKGLGDHDSVKPFPAEGAPRAFEEEPLLDLLEFEDEDEREYVTALLELGGAQPPRAPATAARPAAAVPAGAAPAVRTRGGRRALCVGIDDYPTAPLAGCVNDARTWGRTLRDLDFSVRHLFDGDATETGILTALRELVASGRPGDVLVFQYAGHGTFLPDIDGDEIEDRQDEALVPHDYQQGGSVVDDELGAVYDLLPAGVNLTIFMDCCHSGSNNRLLLSGHDPARLAARGLIRRFMPPTREMLAAQKRRHAGRRGMTRSDRRRRGDAREVLFAACEPWESALEENGQGLFTGHATPLLAGAVAGGWSHAQLVEEVVYAFGDDPPQKPRLTANGRENDPILAPWGSLPGTAAGAAEPPPGGVDAGAIAERLREVLRLLGGER